MMPIETKTEVEVQLTQDQVRKIKDETGLSVSQLRLNVKKDYGDDSQSPRLLECIVL
jgi:hypothetical protein